MRTVLRRVSLQEVRRDHWASILGPGGPGDLLLFLAVPAAVAAVFVVAGGELREVGPLLSGVALIAGLLFGLLMNLFSQASALGSETERPGASTPIAERAKLVEELLANTAWAAVVAFTEAVVLTTRALANRPNDTFVTIVSLLAVAIAIHLLLMLMLLIKRTYQYGRHLVRGARVGSDL